MTLPLLILAGGRGTRLAHQLGGLPKALAPLLDEPFLAHQLRLAARQGIRRVVLCLGHGHELISERMGNGSRYGVELAYSVESIPLGTAGALRNALRLVDGAFLALNGDTWMTGAWGPLVRAHARGRHTCTIGLVETADTSRYGRVTLGPGRLIEAFAEKGLSGPGLINAGLYAIEPAVLAGLACGVPASLEQDVFPQLAAERRLHGHRLRGAHLDIGTPESLARAEGVLRRSLRAQTPAQTPAQTRQGGGVSWGKLPVKEEEFSRQTP